MSSSDKFNLIQITDTHIFGTTDKRLAGTDTRATLARVLEKVSDSNDISYLVVTGDVSMDGSVDSYEWIREQLESTSLPFSVLPGNHDDMSNWLLSFASCQRFPSILRRGSWKLVFLDTQIPGEEYGGISSDTLEFLGREVTSEDGAYLAIFVHHPPLKIGSDWIDSVGLNFGRKEFLNLVSPQKVRLVVAGHVHQTSELEFFGAKIVTTPSTCVQFMPGAQKFALDDNRPGYRLISLFEDGNVKTQVVRVD